MTRLYSERKGQSCFIRRLEVDQPSSEKVHNSVSFEDSPPHAPVELEHLRVVKVDTIAEEGGGYGVGQPIVFPVLQAAFGFQEVSQKMVALRNPGGKGRA